MTLVLHGPSYNPALPVIIPEQLAVDINTELNTYWQPLNSTAGAGPHQRTTGERFADVANVLDYGADPTGQIDSSDAINLAASQMGANGHRKTVYLPTGSYRADKQIRLTDGQTMRGDGEGSTYLLIFDSFDPTAEAVIYCTGSYIDPGPTIRDLGFWFIQPNDLASRSTMKTLAEGGSSFTPGGTGVKYPWAIMAEPASAGHGMSGRIQVNHVVISGAWNGIHADNACYWIDGLKICAFNIGISIGGTIANPVADWSHVSDVEFWTFGCWAGQANIFMDGNTIAMQIGAQNGLTAQNISCFASRLIFTHDASVGWFNFTNLNMDGGQSTIDVNGAIWLLIANLYSSAGGAASTRPCITVTDCMVVQIVNWVGFSADAPYGLLVATGGNTLISNSFLLYYTHTTDAFAVAGGGVLRISDTTLVAAGTVEAWPRPFINQYDTGVLLIDNIHMTASAGSTGTGVQYNTDRQGNYLGAIELPPGWKNIFVGNENSVGHYGNMRVFRPEQDKTSIQCGSYSFNNFTASSHGSTAFGWASLALHQNTSGSNTAVGNIAGYGVTTGSYNCFFGSASGYGVEGGGALTGDNNACYGMNSGRRLSSGSKNTFVGAYAGQSITTASNVVLLGFGVDANPTASNYMNLGGIFETLGTDVANTSRSFLRGRLSLNQLPASASYASDAAASAGGVQVGEFYRNGTAVQVRVV